MPAGSLLFLTLNTFCTTGGIEKVCRVAGKALQEIAHERGEGFAHFAMNDRQEQCDERYVSSANFRGFAGNKVRFIIGAVQAGLSSRTVILSHVHLLVVAIAIKVLSPRTKVILIAHGIEVWKPFGSWKTKLLRRINLILPVSQFTRGKMLSIHRLKESQLVVLNNCLDPYLAPPTISKASFRKRYGLQPEQPVLLTLTRMEFSEQYKGYDRVIAALPQVLKRFPTTVYVIAGKYEAREKERIDSLVAKHGVTKHVIFAGFIADADLPSLFNSADIYIMPSTGEGFGIVFIEAMYYGLPVIAGNVDGSVDALDQGGFGVLVNPDDENAIHSAISSVFQDRNRYLPNQDQVLTKFGFDAYVAHLRSLLH